MPAGKPQSLIGSPGELPPSPFGGMQTRSGKKMWGAAKAKVQAVQAMEGKGSLLAARKLAAETSAAALDRRAAATEAHRAVVEPISTTRKSSF